MFDKLLIPTIVPCRVASFLDGMDEASRENLEKALALPAPRVPHRRIAREILSEAGEKIDPETIAAHRNGTCRCSKR